MATTKNNGNDNSDSNTMEHNRKVGIGQTGQISEFNLKDDDFSSWIERFELFILLNEINSHKKKLMFLTLLGNEGYSLVRDLCIPSKPIDKSYDTLKELLSNYINPKPNLLTERYKFKERKQGSNESISQFIASLKKLSQFCEFGANLDDTLRDQVVYGIKDINIKKRLLSETRLTFKKSVELCLSMEAANNDVSNWENQELNYQRRMKFKSNKASNDKKRGFPKADMKEPMSTNQKSTFTVPGKSKVVCFCCGIAGHTKPFCKYKKLTCMKCSKVGHLKKVCKFKNGNVNSLEQTDNLDEFSDLNIDNLFSLRTVNCNFIKPFNIKYGLWP
jgi:hypothetical protein